MSARRRDEEDPETQLSREFPKLAGSHLTMSDPALEFIKQVCAVLALDNRVQHNIMVSSLPLERPGSQGIFNDVLLFGHIQVSRFKFRLSQF